MSNQDKTDNLNYLVVPTSTKVNRLFVLSFENEADITSYFKYYTLLLIDGKSFFYVPVKNKEEAYEKSIEMSIEIMITQQVTYWIMNTFQTITN